MRNESATIGAALPWIVIGGLAGSAWRLFGLGTGLLVGVVTAILARILLGRAERRRGRDIVDVEGIR